MLCGRLALEDSGKAKQTQEKPEAKKTVIE